MQWNRDGNWGAVLETMSSIRRPYGNHNGVVRRSQIALAGSVMLHVWLILRLSSGDSVSTVGQPACQMSLRMATGYREARYARARSLRKFQCRLADLGDVIDAGVGCRTSLSVR